MSTSAAPPPHQDRTAPWQVLTAIIACITAVIGLLVAFRTLGSEESAGRNEPPVGVLNYTPSAQTTSATSHSTGSTPSFSERAADPGFILTAGGAVDLDVLPKGTPASGDGLADVAYGTDGMAANPLAQIVVLGGVPADYPTCRSATFDAGDKGVPAQVSSRMEHTCAQNDRRTIRRDAHGAHRSRFHEHRHRHLRPTRRMRAVSTHGAIVPTVEPCQLTTVAVRV